MASPDSWTKATDIATIIGGFATVIVVSVAAWQTYSLRKQNEVLTSQMYMSFVMDLHNKLFRNDGCRKVIAALDAGSSGIVFKKNGGECEPVDVGEFLGIFEIMNDFLHKNSVFADIASNIGFLHYVRVAHQNIEIKEYVKQVREAYSNDKYFAGFVELAEKYKGV